MREINYKRIFCSVAILLTLGSTLFASNIFAQRRTIASGKWSDTLVWQDGIIPKAGDTVIISQQDSVFLDTSTAPLAKLFVEGRLAVDTNIIYLVGDTNSVDTAISIRGALDAGSGWFVFSDRLSKRRMIELDSGALFRTKALLPVVADSLFDSLHAPLFVCNLQSTFEYYSANADLIDVSYLANNLLTHTYGNLTLTNVDASFRSNPVGVRGTLRIGFGSSILPSARVSGVRGYDPQVITISGDVINENQGESGGPGAGLRGCGMQSLGTDHWIFNGASNPGFVSHWTGPSQLGTVIIPNGSTLSVRFISDSVCDSLDVLTRLVEEGMPCGGHLIGRVYSEFARTLDGSNPSDDFYGLGLSIRSGTNPYLGRTRVVRTNGYMPPGAKPENNPALRYFQITPGAGPQQGDPNEMTFQLHCTELNAADPGEQHFWRSRNRGRSWSFSGITNVSPQSLSYTWDTTCLGFPNDSGGFYWMLSGGYTDSPNPIELQSLIAQRITNAVRISWQTASESNLLGFEIKRHCTDSEKLIASYLQDSALLGHSRYGAEYGFNDNAPTAGTSQYDLYEVSGDGVHTLLGSRVVSANSDTATSSVGRVDYFAGILKGSIIGTATTSARMIVTDAVGRQILDRKFEKQIACNPGLLPGVYWVRIEWNGGRLSRKLWVGE